MESKSGVRKVGKSENYKTGEERKRSGRRENLCKSIIKGFARRSREKQVISAEVGEDYQRDLCVDDLTGKELQWSEVRHVREKEL